VFSNEVVDRVWEEITPELNEQGYELVEVEYAQESHGRVLRLYIDKENGITLDDCQAASQLTSAILDKADFIVEHYMLEVSSPGYDRPVRKGVDFQRFAGERIRITLDSPIGGRKKFSGVLKGYQDGLVTVDCDGSPYEVHIENIRKANLVR